MPDVRPLLVPVICLAVLTGCGESAGPERSAQVSSAPPANRDRADPATLRIPSIKVDTPLEHLGTTSRGELASPRDPRHAGWFAQGVRPGDPGPAVIVGHVDSKNGPAVFTRLRSLRRGARVLVSDARGSVTAFTVDTVRSYAKKEFPTRDVYGATPDAQLRLITCGGGFDPKTRHYTANVVAYASAATH